MQISPHRGRAADTACRTTRTSGPMGTYTAGPVSRHTRYMFTGTPPSRALRSRRGMCCRALGVAPLRRRDRAPRTYRGRPGGLRVEENPSGSDSSSCSGGGGSGWCSAQGQAQVSCAPREDASALDAGRDAAGARRGQGAGQGESGGGLQGHCWQVSGKLRARARVAGVSREGCAARRARAQSRPPCSQLWRQQHAPASGS